MNPHDISAQFIREATGDRTRGLLAGEVLELPRPPGVLRWVVLGAALVIVGMPLIAAAIAIMETSQ